MDRITYISSSISGLSNADIEEIAAVSQRNNARSNLTGVLFHFKGLFYQILEGEPEALYQCLDRIKNDPRHTGLFVVKVEKGVLHRLYGDWGMKTIALERSKDPVVAPLRNLLDLVTRTYRTMEHYVPHEVLSGLQQGENPLDWELARQEKVVLFADIVGFSTLVEKMDLVELQALLNTFFSIASKAIKNTNGRISKLLGDGFMAYFPMEDCQQALASAVAIILELKSLREHSSSAFGRLVYCGIGISAGDLVEGNIGSSDKKDFTLLGDVVNSAARLQSHTRKKGFPILFDHRFRNCLNEQTKWSIKSLGTYQPKGKTQRLKIFTLEHPHLIFEVPPTKISQKLKIL